MHDPSQSGAFAMVSIYDSLDRDLLEESSFTFWSCRHSGDAGLTIIPVQRIQSVVAVIPHPTFTLNNPDLVQQFDGRYYVVEKLGLDIGILAGENEDDDENGPIPNDLDSN